MGKFDDYIGSLDNLDAWPEGGLTTIQGLVGEDIAALQAGADASIATLAQENTELKTVVMELQAHNYQLMRAATPLDNNDGGVDDPPDEDDDDDESERLGDDPYAEDEEE